MNLAFSWRPKILVLIILSVTLILVTATVALGLPGGSQPSSEPSPGALLTSSRDRLAICIQSAADAQFNMAEAQLRVQAALAELSTHPKWSTLGLAGLPPAVDAGCPTAPYLLQPGVAVKGGKPTGDPATQQVVDPSKYRVFLFVLPPPEIERIFAGPTSLRMVPEQFRCQGHTCFEVTTGLYLSPAEVQNHAFLKIWLAKSIAGVLSDEPIQKDVSPPQR